MPRRVGRPSLADLDDREARTPTGRWLHRQEGGLFEISRCGVAYRDTVAPIRLQHDAAADEAIRRIEATGVALAAHPDPLVSAHGRRILGHCADYWRHDEREDAAALSGDALVAAIHAVSRRLAGWVEQACLAVRGKR